MPIPIPCILCGNGRYCTGQLIAKAFYAIQSPYAKQAAAYCYTIDGWEHATKKINQYCHSQKPKHHNIYLQLIHIAYILNGSITPTTHIHPTCGLVASWLILIPTTTPIRFIGQCQCKSIKQLIQLQLDQHMPIQHIIQHYAHQFNSLTEYTPPNPQPEYTSSNQEPDPEYTSSNQEPDPEYTLSNQEPEQEPEQELGSVLDYVALLEWDAVPPPDYSELF
jgi:hypothetical protein